MTTNQDRRVTKTKQALRCALDELLEETSYSKISVQDIVERADVGRSTFYTHYAGKDDLLERSCFTTQIARAFVTCLDGPARSPDFEVLFEHFARPHRHYQLVFGSEGWQYVWETARRDLHQNWLAWASLQDELPMPPELTAHFLTGGVLSLMQGWLEEGAPLTAEALTETLAHLVLPLAPPNA